MTATTVPSRRPRAVAPAVPGRLVWIEIKRNAVLWALPLLGALVYFDTYRTVSRYPPIWTVRALIVPDRLVFDFAAFAGGFSAWAGSREGRRKTGDLLASTVRPVWRRQLAALAGTMFWLVLAFGVAVAVLYVQFARVVAWGGPPLWRRRPAQAAGTGRTVLALVLGGAPGLAARAQPPRTSGGDRIRRVRWRAAGRAGMALDVRQRPARTADPDDHRGGRGGGDRGDQP
jgi:hypothetical protein